MELRSDGAYYDCDYAQPDDGHDAVRSAPSAAFAEAFDLSHIEQVHCIFWCSFMRSDGLSTVLPVWTKRYREYCGEHPSYDSQYISLRFFACETTYQMER